MLDHHQHRQAPLQVWDLHQEWDLDLVWDLHLVWQEHSLGWGLHREWDLLLEWVLRQEWVHRKDKDHYLVNLLQHEDHPHNQWLAEDHLPRE